MMTDNEQSNSQDLLSAAYSGRLIGVDQALSQGADIDFHDPDSKNTPLIAAICGEHSAVVDLLLAKGADANKIGWIVKHTPLHWAAERCAPEILTSLIKWGARVNEIDGDERTPLMKVRDVGSAEVLIDAGADIHYKTTKKETVLHEACGPHYFDLLKVIELLCEKGADVNAIDANGLTPLHNTLGNISKVKLLLKYGANPTISTKQGTPREYMRRINSGGRTEEKELLLLQAEKVFTLRALYREPVSLVGWLLQEMTEVVADLLTNTKDGYNVTKPEQPNQETNMSSTFLHCPQRDNTMSNIYREIGSRAHILETFGPTLPMFSPTNDDIVSISEAERQSAREILSRRAQQQIARQINSQPRFLGDMPQLFLASPSHRQLANQASVEQVVNLIENLAPEIEKNLEDSNSKKVKKSKL